MDGVEVCPVADFVLPETSHCSTSARNEKRFMTAASDSDNPPQGINRRRLVLRLIGLPVFIALFMFLPAGTWEWP